MLRKLRRLIAAPIFAPEQRSIELSGRTIPYLLKRSPHRRSIGLRIDHRGLTVSVPAQATDTWLHDVLRERGAWVLDKLGHWQSRQTAVQVWVDGATLPFRGELLTLRLASARRTSVSHSEGVLTVNIADPENAAAIERAVTTWYRREAMTLFDECVAFYAERMGVSPQAVKLTSARTRWGSCTSRGVIRLNWRLVRLSLDLVDYVVVHELAHLREMNHSAAFWQVVEAACPDHVSRRKALRQYALAE